MRAIILAAGRGSRMGGHTATTPKCLLPLGGRTLLDRQLGALRGAGIERIALVTGWQAGQLAGRGATTFHNERWADTNMVMSLASAASWLDADTCIVSYSDIFYSTATVAALMEAEGDIAMTYDPKWLALWARRFADPLADAETFATDAAGMVTDIGRKADSLEQIKGQYMGLLKITPAGWSAVSRLLAALAPLDRDRLDMTGLLRRLIAAGTTVRAVAATGPWGEVDSESDLALYERDFSAGPG